MSKPANAFDELKARILNVRGVAYVALLFLAVWTSVEFAGNVTDLAEHFWSDDKLQNAQNDLQPLYFQWNSDILIEESNERLKKYAEKIKSLMPNHVVIEGHSREINPNYNIKLSESRAVSVRDNLIHLGIEHTILEVKSFGAKEPLKGKESYSPYNDRVEIKLKD